MDNALVVFFLMAWLALGVCGVMWARSLAAPPARTERTVINYRLDDDVELVLVDRQTSNGSVTENWRARVKRAEAKP